MHLTSKNRTETTKFILDTFYFLIWKSFWGKNKIQKKKNLYGFLSVTSKKIISENISVQRVVQLFRTFPLKFSVISLISFKPSWSGTYCISLKLFVLTVTSYKVWWTEIFIFSLSWPRNPTFSGRILRLVHTKRQRHRHRNKCYDDGQNRFTTYSARKKGQSAARQCYGDGYGVFQCEQTFKGPFTPDESEGKGESFLWCLPFILWSFSLSLKLSLGVNRSLIWIAMMSYPQKPIRAKCARQTDAQTEPLPLNLVYT